MHLQKYQPSDTSSRGFETSPVRLRRGGEVSTPLPPSLKLCDTPYHSPCGRCLDGGPCLGGKLLVPLVKNVSLKVEFDPYLLIHGNNSYTPTVTPLSAKVSELPGDSAAKDHKARLERYALAHKRAVLMSEWIHQNKKKQKPLIANLTDCGDRLTFRAYYTVQQIRLHEMHS